MSAHRLSSIRQFLGRLVFRSRSSQPVGNGTAGEESTLRPVVTMPDGKGNGDEVMMAESEWDSFTDPQQMLGFLRGKASARKLRLFAYACCS